MAVTCKVMENKHCMILKLKKEKTMKEKKKYSPPSTECLEFETTGLIASSAASNNSKPGDWSSSNDATGSDTWTNSSSAGSSSTVGTWTKGDESEW
jgi:hypothetical protein